MHPLCWVTFSAILALASATEPAPIQSSLMVTDADPATSEHVQVGDATLVVSRRSKTPHSLPKPVSITSTLLNVKSQPSTRRERQMEIGADGIPIIHGVRTPDDESDRHFTWRNARVIKNILIPNSDTAPHYLPTQRQQRLVTVDAIRPTIVDEGVASVRAPVLQYAHPELGAQPALSAPDYESTESPRNTAHGIIYFARDNPQDIHNDHSPYSFEPAELMHQKSYDEAAVRQYSKQFYPTEQKVRAAKKSQSQLYYDGGSDLYAKYNKARPQSMFSAWNKEHKYKYLPEETSFYAIKDPRNMWQVFSDMLHSHVQTGVARMTDLARPIVDPLVSATHTISHNLGLAPKTGVQEKVGVVGPIFAAHTMLPALGLVAGGAALGLGAAAVGRYIETAHSQVTEAKRRRRRDVFNAPEHEYQDASNENVLRVLEEGPESFLTQLSRYGYQGWSEDSQCAKRIFCDVMRQQPGDAAMLMEKRMATFLSLIQPSVARSLGGHMTEVMDAVRRRDCSTFLCRNAARRSGAINGAAVEAPFGGPGPR